MKSKSIYCFKVLKKREGEAYRIQTESNVSVFQRYYCRLSYNYLQILKPKSKSLKALSINSIQQKRLNLWEMAMI